MENKHHIGITFKAIHLVEAELQYIFASSLTRRKQGGKGVDSQRNQH